MGSHVTNQWLVMIEEVDDAVVNSLKFLHVLLQREILQHHRHHLGPGGRGMGRDSTKGGRKGEKEREGGGIMREENGEREKRVK